MVDKHTFFCKRCGNCCRYAVLLLDDDIHTIEKKGYDRTDFVDIDLDGRMTVKQKKGYCMFTKHSKDGVLCGIYEQRPMVCRQYPFNSYDSVESCNPEDNLVLAKYKSLCKKL